MAIFDVTLRLPDGRDHTEAAVADTAAEASAATCRRAAWIYGVDAAGLTVAACLLRGDAEPDLFAPRRAA